MPGSYVMKSTALGCLRKKWPQAMVVTIIVLSLSILRSLFESILMQVFKIDFLWNPAHPVNFPKYNIIASVGISVFSLFFVLFIVLPLIYGVMRWFWYLTLENDIDVLDIFHYYSCASEYGKAVGISLGIAIRTIILAVACFSPSIILTALAEPQIYSLFGFTMPENMTWLFSVSTYLSAFGAIVFVLLFTRYILFFAILFSEPDLSAHKTIKKATWLANGCVVRYLLFIASFTGWIVLCIFVLPIVFVVPYFLASITLFGRYAVYHKLGEQKSFENIEKSC